MSIQRYLYSSCKQISLTVLSTKLIPRNKYSLFAPERPKVNKWKQVIIILLPALRRRGEAQNPTDAPVHERIADVLDEHDLGVHLELERLHRHHVVEQLLPLHRRSGPGVPCCELVNLAAEGGHARRVGPLDFGAQRE